MATVERQERRRHPRVKKSLPLKISADDFDIVTETKDLSCIGAYCTVDRYIEPMTKLKILILLPMYLRKKIMNKKVECNGVVVRTEESKNHQYNIAIFFNNITSQDMKKISNYVNSQLKNSETK